jgi:hypothetical protein
MLISGKNYSGVLFVHIPKTAGSSISKILDENGLDKWNRGWPRHHDPYSYLKDANTIDENIFSFSVVRNPYTRTYSCYKQFNKVNQTNISFVEYLENIKNNKISKLSPLLHIPQSFYVMDDRVLQVNKVYRFEDLKELEEDFGWQLGFYNVGSYSAEAYLKDYTPETVEMTNYFYDSDFVNFGYRKDFYETVVEK